MTTPFNDKDHPMWPIIRLIVLMATLVVVLWLTASKFDETEIITILVIFLAGAGLEGFRAYIPSTNN